MTSPSPTKINLGDLFALAAANLYHSNYELTHEFTSTGMCGAINMAIEKLLQDMKLQREYFMFYARRILTRALFLLRRTNPEISIGNYWLPTCDESQLIRFTHLSLLSHVYSHINLYL